MEHMEAALHWCFSFGLYTKVSSMYGNDEPKRYRHPTQQPHSLKARPHTQRKGKPRTPQSRDPCTVLGVNGYLLWSLWMSWKIDPASGFRPHSVCTMLAASSRLSPAFRSFCPKGTRPGKLDVWDFRVEFFIVRVFNMFESMM